MNPSQAGSYNFNIRAYNVNSDYVLRYTFPIVVQPDTIVTAVYAFNTVL